MIVYITNKLGLLTEIDNTVYNIRIEKTSANIYNSCTFNISIEYLETISVEMILGIFVYVFIKDKFVYSGIVTDFSKDYTNNFYTVKCDDFLYYLAKTSILTLQAAPSYTGTLQKLEPQITVAYNSYTRFSSKTEYNQSLNYKTNLSLQNISFEITVLNSPILTILNNLISSLRSNDGKDYWINYNVVLDENNNLQDNLSISETPYQQWIDGSFEPRFLSFSFDDTDSIYDWYDKGYDIIEMKNLINVVSTINYFVDKTMGGVNTQYKAIYDTNGKYIETVENSKVSDPNSIDYYGIFVKNIKYSYDNLLSLHGIKACEYIFERNAEPDDMLTFSIAIPDNIDEYRENDIVSLKLPNSQDILTYEIKTIIINPMEVTYSLRQVFK